MTKNASKDEITGVKCVVRQNIFKNVKDLEREQRSINIPFPKISMK